MQRLQTRPQFQAVLAGTIVARTDHFVLHQNTLDAKVPLPNGKHQPTGGPSLQGAINVTPQTLARTEGLAGSPASASKSRHVSLFPRVDVWMGAMVPKRWARRAVTRNAIKRQIYTVSAEFSDAYPPAAYVVRLRREFSRKLFISAVSSDLKEAVRHEIVALMNAGMAPR